MGEHAWPPKTADGAFATTQWTMIFDAAQDGEGASSRALSKLCETYWLPVYAFVRRRGESPENAKDLTQEFFAQLLEKKPFATADKEKGRFRSYLLGAVKFFLSNERRMARTGKRGGGVRHLSMDTDEAEGVIASELVETVTPEILFERQWIRVVMKEAAEVLRVEYAHKGKGDQCDLLLPFVLEDLVPQGASTSYADIAASHDVSETSLRMAVSRLRKRYGETLREQIAGTVDSPEDVDDEVKSLLAVLAS